MNPRIVIGLIATIIGSIALVDSLSIIRFSPGLVLAVILTATGIFSLYVNIRTSKDVFSFVVGIMCLSLGLSLISKVLGVLPRGGNVFISLGISLSFLVIYLNKQTRWWAVLPMGLFFVLGVIQIIDLLFQVRQDRLFFLLFLGLALTFYYLFLIRSEEKPFSWALYPSIFLFLVGILHLVGDSIRQQTSLFIGLILIILGIIYILRHRGEAQAGSSGRNGGGA